MVFLKCLYCSEDLETTFLFCSRCGAAVDKEEALIRYYFERGFYYSVILQFLKKYHAIEMSMRTLHNRLRLGLRKRDTNTDDRDANEMITYESLLFIDSCSTSGTKQKRGLKVF